MIITAFDHDMSNDITAYGGKYKKDGSNFVFFIGYNN